VLVLHVGFTVGMAVGAAECVRRFQVAVSALAIAFMRDLALMLVVKASPSRNQVTTAALLPRMVIFRKPVLLVTRGALGRLRQRLSMTGITVHFRMHAHNGLVYLDTTRLQPVTSPKEKEQERKRKHAPV